MPGTTPPSKSPLRSYFVTGLLIWVPLVITLWVINLIVSTMDQTLLLLPEQLQPERLFGGHRVPGVGVVLASAGSAVSTTVTATLKATEPRTDRAYRAKREKANVS